MEHKIPLEKVKQKKSGQEWCAACCRSVEVIEGKPQGKCKGKAAKGKKQTITA